MKEGLLVCFDLVADLSLVSLGKHLVGTMMIATRSACG